MKFKSESGMRAVPQDQWSTLTDSDFPFSDHDFLSALEESDCVGEESGWIPCHLTMRENDILKGALYLYEKNNGYGEYIFDWGWAQAYERNGLNYYPKLVSAVPFTPATGRKLLVHPDEDDNLVREKLLEEALGCMRRRNCSSLHFLYISAEELKVFNSMGFLIRHSFQFHWKNNNYQDFDQFLSTLKGKRRKEIIRERKQIKEQMISISVLEGKDITREHIAQMYKFYISTTTKKWGHPYLSLDFFYRIHQTMQKKLLLIFAYVDNECVAGAINFQKGNRLYGRHWGCKGNFRSLHFELCYYQPIEFAIRNGISLFEAGAQGEHKIQRGFLPELTYSAHWLEHKGFRSSISNFLEEEKESIRQGLKEFSPHSPYRDSNSVSAFKSRS
ncbi:MAG: GNAT family N-acetyltransferase [Deltaproteobacteria bacterium]|nr:GNAT family N-acetyltransferase [Deltaproteobacteria bacterium]